MKRIAIIFIFCGVALAQDMTELISTTKEILEKQNREDLSSVIPSSYNPFDPSVLKLTQQEGLDDANMTLEENPSPTKLQAVFGNSVKIDGVWLKKGEFVKGFKVEKIEKKSVYLSKENESLSLKLFENPNIKGFN